MESSKEDKGEAGIPAHNRVPSSADAGTALRRGCPTTLSTLLSQHWPQDLGVVVVVSSWASPRTFSEPASQTVLPRLVEFKNKTRNFHPIWLQEVMGQDSEH